MYCIRNSSRHWHYKEQLIVGKHNLAMYVASIHNEHDCYHNLSVFFVYLVPGFVSTVSVEQQEYYYAGSSLIIACNVQLPQTIDIAVALAVEWFKDASPMTESDRITIEQAVQTETLSYQATLEFSTLSFTVDSGIYNCTAVAYPVSKEEHVTNSTSVALHTLQVNSKLKLNI